MDIPFISFYNFHHQQIANRECMRIYDLSLSNQNPKQKLKYMNIFHKQVHLLVEHGKPPKKVIPIKNINIAYIYIYIYIYGKSQLKKKKKIVLYL